MTPIEVEGGVTAPRGYQAAGVACGIKKNGRRDLAIVASEHPCSAAALLTTNQFLAAPLLLTRERLKRLQAQAVVINSGTANACTGARGLANARAVADAAASILGIESRLVLVASTGVIGEFLPMKNVLAGVAQAGRALSRSGGHEAAEAILTTDTFTKEYALRGRAGGQEITVGGMAKGSGMIHPGLATLLAFITTDAVVSPAALKSALREAARVSFNRISVDGDRSTNDLLLAFSRREGRRILPGSAPFRSFTRLLIEVCRVLAHRVVEDGEGVTKIITIDVSGAKSEKEAELAGMAIARSPLVKTAFFGEDANWGRIMAALGAASLRLEPERISLDFACGNRSVPIVRRGVGTPAARRDEAAEILKGREITVRVRLGRGRGRAVIHTTDLSLRYVEINASYRS